MNDDLDQFEDMELFQYGDEELEVEAAPEAAPESVLNDGSFRIVTVSADEFGLTAVSNEPEPVSNEPEPVAEAAPSGNTENWSNEVLNRMGYHLRKREKYGITVEQAVEKILTDSATHDEYKKLKKETQKFSGM
jgi:hypothetical protein